MKSSSAIPADLSDQVIAHTGIVGGGEGDTKELTIEFAAPEPGDYPFLCSFPGHFAMMNGTFRVVAAAE